MDWLVHRPAGVARQVRRVHDRRQRRAGVEQAAHARLGVGDVVAHGVERVGGNGRPVAGHDAVTLRARQRLQIGKGCAPAYGVAIAQFGNARDRHQRAGEHHTAVQVAHHEVAGRTGPAGVDQREAASAGVDRRAALDLPVWRVDTAARHLVLAEYLAQVVQAVLAAGGDQLGAGAVGQHRDALVGEGCCAHHEFLHRLGDHHQHHRLAADALCCREQGAAVAVGGAGIDHHRAAVADHEADVADPAAVGPRGLAGVADEYMHAVGQRERVLRARAAGHRREHEQGSEPIRPAPKDACFSLLHAFAPLPSRGEIS